MYRLAFQQAFLDLWRRKPTTFFILLQLCLGFSSIFTVESFKSSIETQLSEKSKSLQGADFSVRVRRDFTEEEEKIISTTLPSEWKKAKVVSFFSMIQAPEGSKLVQVQTMPHGFPFYGEIRTKNQSELSSGKLWLSEDAKLALSVSLKDKLLLGDLELEYSDTVLEDPMQSFRFGQLAPKAYLHPDSLEKTKLLGTGSTKNTTLYFYTPESTSEELLRHKESLFNLFTDPGIRIQTYHDSEDQGTRPLQYTADFLSLISLITTALALFSVYFVLSHQIDRRVKDYALQISLGSKPKLLQWRFFFLILLYFVPAVILSLLLSYPATLYLLQQSNSLIPYALSFDVPWTKWVLVILFFFVSCLLLFYPLFRKLSRLMPQKLFQEALPPFQPTNFKENIAFLPALFLLYFSFVYLSSSLLLGSAFFFTLLLSSILLNFTYIFLLKLFSKLSPKNPLFKITLFSLLQQRTKTISSLVILSLSLMLLSLIFHFESTLRSELEADSSKRPKLFIFDVQDDQIESLKAYVKSQSLELEYPSPWIRARFLSINGKKFEKQTNSDLETRENEREGRFRNRTLNLSIRDHLQDSEDLVEGTIFPGEYDSEKQNYPFVSIEKRYAETLGIELGDQLEFEVSGRKFTFEVINIRRVRWISFQPNFFVQVQPGVLEKAPKTWIGTLSQISSNQKSQTQNRIVSKFPNLSVLDVEATLKKILDLMNQLLFVLKGMAFLTLFTGLSIFILLLIERSSQKKKETLLFTMLGAPDPWIQKFMVFESIFLFLLTSIIGLSLSSGVSFLFSKLFFDSAWTLSWNGMAILFFTFLVLSVLSSLLFVRSLRSNQPLYLFKEESSL